MSGRFFPLVPFFFSRLLWLFVLLLLLLLFLCVCDSILTVKSFILVLWKILLVVWSVELFSCVWLSETPWTAAHQASLNITNSQSLFKLMSIELVMPSDHQIHYHPFLLLSSTFIRIRVFSNESVICIKGPKYWSFSFIISPSNAYSGLISLRIYWFDLLIVQGTFKSLLQHHSTKASVFQCSAFFMVKLSQPYLASGKNIALLIQTYVSNVTSLLFIYF